MVQYGACMGHVWGSMGQYGVVQYGVVQYGAVVSDEFSCSLSRALTHTLHRALHRTFRDVAVLHSMYVDWLRRVVVSRHANCTVLCLTFSLTSLACHQGLRHTLRRTRASPLSAFYGRRPQRRVAQV